MIGGGCRSDLIGGGIGDDVIHGQRGLGRNRGDGGDDTLNGNFGSDRLRGNAGDDRLDGGFGDNTLSDGQDKDVLLGRQGAHVFEMALDGDMDEIRDFENGTDRIDPSARGIRCGNLLIETRQIGGLRITWDDEILILKTKTGTIAAGDIDSGDFLF
ncbi:calcium-binding protein [Mangrovicoccus ximenensis]|uniref:calcium-binding protein n=1 Tax=Mangrovicoccus ximenensis TaxID=1911570 RepID=UPI000D356A5A|nr:hypothetical protein [Mangrovicoccus ximenensis]